MLLIKSALDPARFIATGVLIAILIDVSRLPSYAAGLGAARDGLAVMADGEGLAPVGWMRQSHPDIGFVLAGSIDQATRKAGDLCTDEPAITKAYGDRLILDRIRGSLSTRDRPA